MVLYVFEIKHLSIQTAQTHFVFLPVIVCKSLLRTGQKCSGLPVSSSFAYLLEAVVCGLSPSIFSVIVVMPVHTLLSRHLTFIPSNDTTSFFHYMHSVFTFIHFFIWLVFFQMGGNQAVPEGNLQPPGVYI